MVRSIIPGFDQNSRHESFENLGVDSIDLVTLRVEFENSIGTTIPDSIWMSFKSFDDIFSYCGSFGQSDNDRNTNLSGGLSESQVVNMPEMALEGLSENWLFKKLGDLHWKLLCEGLNTRSDRLYDELENRLYATFVRIRLEGSTTFASIGENDVLSFNSSIERYGNGLYFSKIQIEIGGKGNFLADLMTSFSIRKSTGNKELAKSQPSASANLIKNNDQIPAFGDEYRKLKKSEQSTLNVAGETFEILETSVFQCRYELNPYYDLNGVGLLYFASYPVINDFCESKYFNEHHNDGGGKRWEEKFSTEARDILYYANCDVSDSIVYHLNSYDFIEGGVKISSSLVRESDGVLMARIFCVKRKNK